MGNDGDEEKNKRESRCKGKGKGRQRKEGRRKTSNVLNWVLQNIYCVSDGLWADFRHPRESLGTLASGNLWHLASVFAYCPAAGSDLRQPHYPEHSEHRVRVERSMARFFWGVQMSLNFCSEPGLAGTRVHVVCLYFFIPRTPCSPWVTGMFPSAWRVCLFCEVQVTRLLSPEECSFWSLIAQALGSVSFIGLCAPRYDSTLCAQQAMLRVIKRAFALISQIWGREHICNQQWVLLGRRKCKVCRSYTPCHTSQTNLYGFLPCLAWGRNMVLRIPT